MSGAKLGEQVPIILKQPLSFAQHAQVQRQ